MPLRNSQPLGLSLPFDSTNGGSVGCEAPNSSVDQRGFKSPAPTHLRHLRVSGGFSFTGTAADHLQRTERAIREARKGHKPVRGLLRRKRLLTARCAALGAANG
jgi:hypothetical protein